MWLSAWFRIDRQGSSGSNVPTWRLFDGSKRIIDLHRQNVSGDLWLRSSDGQGGWRYVKIGRRLELGRWYHVKLHVYANWSRSDVGVWVNGTRLYRSASHRLPTGRLSQAMIGAEHVRQVMDLSFDRAIMKVVVR